ncbi:MAG: hypothetical protein Q8L24_01305 [bacterium]|nr:hypothetical protein [bacterium]
MGWFILVAVVCLVLVGWTIKWAYEEIDGGAALVVAVVGSLIALLAVPLAGAWIAALTTGAVPGYSDGDRVGYVTKVSNKGLIWKTWEGQMQVGQGAQVATQQLFEFSVVDDKVRANLEAALSSGKKVKIHYSQWLTLPYRMGDSNYVVTSVEVLNEPLPAEKK